MAGVVARKRVEHLFFSGVSLLLVVYVLLGFWRSYIGAGLVLAPLPSLLAHVHAVLFVGWIGLFLVQAGLIGSGRVAVHRRLGVVMGVWAAAMVLVGPAIVVMALRRPGSGVGAGALAGDLAQTLAFLVLVGLGLRRRRDGAQHKRLMLLGSAAISGPAIVRWPFAFIQGSPPVGPGVFYLLPVALLACYDVATGRRVRGVTWLGLGLMVGVLLSFFVLPARPEWQAFTAWLRQG